MNPADYHFDLPQSLIGQKAIEPRDACRLLRLDKQTGQVSHHRFYDLLSILDQSTVLVLNETQVFPARLFGTKDTGGRVEVLLLKQLALDTYECLVRGHLRLGQVISFAESLTAGVVARDDDGLLNLQFNQSGRELLNTLDQLGQTPLPPYIHSSAKEADLRRQYQTVYARERGSAAAPTAGLHFTEDLLAQLIAKGIQIEKITLHVGLGTFKPVTEEQIASKTLHSESFVISPQTAAKLNQAKQAGKKIIAVGTTTCRTLEYMTDDQGQLRAGEGETNLFIQPGYRFKYLDGLITNFHLPHTSLLMLVTALTTFPNSPIHLQKFADSPIGLAYREAIKQKYLFFSFGDAMLIL